VVTMTSNNSSLITKPISLPMRPRLRRPAAFMEGCPSVPKCFAKGAAALLAEMPVV
jgi:hypothetical protein